MSKPKWDDAPEWANYLAMDKDGAWLWYQYQPAKHEGFWSPKAGIYELCYDPPNWEETLEARP